MSSSDSQAKTISLVVFVLLTVVSSSLAYYFWSQTDLLAQKAAEADKARSAAQQSLTTAKKEYEELRGAVGIDPKEAHASVMQLANAELQNPKISEERKRQKTTYQHYSDSLKYLHAELEASDRRVAALEQENTTLKNELKATKEKYDAEVAKAKAAQEAKTKELADESSKFLAANSKKDEQIEELLNQSQFVRDQNTQLRRDLESREKAFERMRVQQQAIIDNLKQEAELATSVLFEHKDGEIILVQDGGQVAHIDLGIEDGVRKGLSFGVYGRDGGGNPYKLPKAGAEVVRLLGPHKAMVKITGNSITEPVLAGDLLYNPIWSPGEKETVAVIGKIYMDDDDEPDNEEFNRLVEDMGGKVVAWVDIKTGKMMGGEITTQTGWLVEGEIPDPANKEFQTEQTQLDKEIFKSSDELRRRAREAGVRIINVRNFLTYMGHNAVQNTVPSGREYQFFYGKRRPKLVDKLGEEKGKVERGTRSTRPSAASRSTPPPAASRSTPPPAASRSTPPPAASTAKPSEP